MSVDDKKQKNKEKLDDLMQKLAEININDLSDIDVPTAEEFHRVTRGGPLIEELEKTKPTKKIKKKRFTIE